MSDNSIYEMLKQEMKNASSRYGLADEEIIKNFSKTNPDQFNMRFIFSKVLSSRDEVFKSFEKLLEIKLNLYEYSLTTFMALYYLKRVESLSNDLSQMLALLLLVSSNDLNSAVNDYLDRMNLVGQLGGPVIPENLDDLKTAMENSKIIENYKNYFKRLAGIAINIFTNETNPISTTFWNSSTKTANFQGINPFQNFRHFLIYTLQLLWNANIGTDFSKSIQTSSDYFDIVFNEIKKEAKRLLDAIVKNYSSFISVEDLREKEDPYYYKDYSNIIKLKFESLREEMQKISFLDMTRQSVFFETGNGYFSNFSTTPESLISFLSNSQSISFIIGFKFNIVKNEILNIYSDNLSNIKLLDDYLDNYIPIIRFSKRYSDILRDSINILFKIPSLNLAKAAGASGGQFFPRNEEEAEKLIETINSFNFDNLYFSFLEPLDNEIIDFETWNRTLLESLVSESIFSSLLLYIGKTLQNMYPGESRKYINYAVDKIVRQSSIPDSEVKEDYLNIKRKELSLLKEYNLRVRENINNEKIPSSLKTLLPEMDVVELFSIKEILSVNDTITNPSPLADAIRFQFLKSVLANKERINEILVNVIDIFERNKYNFKSLYINYAIRTTLKQIMDYTENISTDITDETRSFVTSYTDSNEEFLKLIKIINDYREVWRFFYFNSTNQNLSQLILKPGSKLRDLTI
jgi:hypothetical protein